MAFNVHGLDPRAVADALDSRGIEARAGCHCATLAHLDLGLTPPASCRLSFAAYTSPDDVDRALDALERVVRRTSISHVAALTSARNARKCLSTRTNEERAMASSRRWE